MASSDEIASLYGTVKFRVDQNSVKSVFKALDRIQSSVRQIQKQIDSISLTKKFADNFKNMSREATKSATALNEINNKAKSGINPINDYARAIGGLAMQFGALRQNMVSSLPKPSTVGGVGANASMPSAGVQGSTARGFLSGLVGGPGAFARGIVPGLGAGWLVRQSVGSYRDMLSTEYALQSITGSEQAGQAEMGYLKGFSNKYGLDVKSSAQQYKGILAAARGTKLEGNAARKIYEGVSLQGAALGLDKEKMKRATTAIQQMIGKGKVMAEELKGQLAEALPDAVRVFAQAQGVTVAQMFKMMENGEILSEDILPKVAKIYEQMAKEGGGLDKHMASSLAAQNRLMNSFNEFMTTLAKSGLDRMLAGVFDTLNGIVKSLNWLLSEDAWGVWATAGVLATGAILKNLGLIQIIMRGVWDIAKVSAFAKATLNIMTVLGRGIFLRFLPVMMLFDFLDAQARDKRSVFGDAVRNIFGLDTPKTEEWAAKQVESGYKPNIDTSISRDTMTPQQRAKAAERAKMLRESLKEKSSGDTKPPVSFIINGATDPQEVANHVMSTLDRVWGTAIENSDSVVFNA